MNSASFLIRRTGLVLLFVATFFTAVNLLKADCWTEDDVNGEGIFLISDSNGVYQTWAYNIMDFLYSIDALWEWIVDLEENHQNPVWVDFWAGILEPVPGRTYELYITWSDMQDYYVDDVTGIFSYCQPYWDGYPIDVWAIEGYEAPASDGSLLTVDADNPNRNVDIGSTLLMVSHENAVRSAVIGLETDCPTFLPGYPSWSGISYSSVPTLAVFESSGGTGNISVNLGDGNVVGTAVVQVISSSPQSFTVTPSALGSGFISKIGQVLSVLGTEVEGQVTGGWTGEASIIRRRSDDYHDASDWDYRYDFQGSAGFSLPGLELKSPGLPVAGLFTLKAVGTISPFTIALTQGGYYDPAEASPGGVSLSLSGLSNVSFGGIVAIAQVCNVFSVTGGSTVSVFASGPGSSFPDTAAINGTVGASEFSITVSLAIEIGGYQCSLWDRTYQLGGEFEVDLPTVTIF